MPSSGPGGKRLLLRGVLVAAMVLAGVGLMAVWKAGRNAPDVSLARQAGLRVAVVDEEGRVIPHAEVVLPTAGGRPRDRVRWSPASGAWMLPATARGHDVRVLARGFRVRDVADVDNGTTIVLERGLLLRIRTLDVPGEGLPSRVLVMLRIRPEDGSDAPSGLSIRTLVDLMADRGGPGPRGMPRGSFGLPVSPAQGRRGILLPRPGRYRITWGLIDARTRTWYSVGARASRMVDVQADRSVRILVERNDLQATLEGLRAGVAKAHGMALR